MASVRSHGDLGAQARAAAGRAFDGDRPVEHGDAVHEAAQAGPAARVGAADAVVGDVHDHAATGAPDCDARPGRVGVLRDVLERLGGDEVGGALDGAGQPAGGDVDADGHGRAVGERAQGRLEAAVGQDGGVDPARELAQLGEAYLQLVGGTREQVLQVRVGGGARPGTAEQQRQRDEARLRAVVEVALEAPALRVAGLDEAGARGTELHQALARLGVEVAHVAAQQAAEERERRHAGRDEGGPPRGLAGAGAGDRDEEERRERAGVDRGQLHPLERVARAPAAHGAREHDGEQREVQQRARAGQGVRGGGVAVDEQDVGRAGVAAELVRAGEEQGGHEGEREDDVPGRGEPAVDARREAAAGEAEAEVQEDAAPQAARDERKGVHGRGIGGVEGEEEPREPEKHHQRAGAVLRPPPPGVQAGADEAPADGGPEGRPDRLGVLVAARELERGDARAGGDGGRDDRGEPGAAGPRGTARLRDDRGPAADGGRPLGRRRNEHAPRRLALEAVAGRGGGLGLQKHLGPPRSPHALRLAPARELIGRPAESRRTRRRGRLTGRRGAIDSSEGREVAVRAIVVTKQGGPEGLELRDEPDPEAGRGQLLVDVEAVGVNFRDIYEREGAGGYSNDPPFVAGAEGAGTVAAVGEGVHDFSVGNRVAWAAASGSYAERVVVDEGKAVAVPDGVTTEVAAAAILQGMTAHYLAVDTYAVQPNDPVLVHAAAGGVGLLLTQIVKLRGGRVIATTGSDEKAELARAAGADHVLGHHGVADEARELSGGAGGGGGFDGIGQGAVGGSPAGPRPPGGHVAFRGPGR